MGIILAVILRIFRRLCYFGVLIGDSSRGFHQSFVSKEFKLHLNFHRIRSFAIKEFQSEFQTEIHFQRFTSALHSGASIVVLPQKSFNWSFILVFYTGVSFGVLHWYSAEISPIANRQSPPILWIPFGLLFRSTKLFSQFKTNNYFDRLSDKDPVH